MSLFFTYRKRGQFFLGFLFLAIVALSLFYFWFSRPEHGSLFSEEYWAQHIIESGIKNTYADFVHSHSKVPILRQHFFEHVFGGALYRQGNIEALSLCGEGLFYGCIHEFVGRHIAEEGIASISSIALACEETTLNKSVCMHSLGHGVLAHFGYHTSDLKEALATCDVVSSNNIEDMLGGCHAGVFMEFNLRTMMGEGNIRSSKEGAISPCTELDDLYWMSCAFRLPQWWEYEFIDVTDKKLAEELGNRCMLVPDMYRSACFQGIGNVLIDNTGFDLGDSGKLCDMSTEEKEYGMMCRTQAFVSKGFLKGVNSSDIEAACENLPYEEGYYCEGALSDILELNTQNTK